MSQKPIISVVIPVYQAEEYLVDCLESVLAQTYRNLEVLLVDDCSTDASASICEKYCQSDLRFKLIRRESNGGLSAARNTGIDAASGEYLLFLDSDDVIAANHIALLLRALINTQTDIAITSLTPFTSVFTSNNAIDQYEVLSAEEAVEVVFYQGAFDTCAPAKLYPASMWEGIRFPEGYIHEDLPTVYKVLLRSKRCVYVESDSYGYRFQQDGLNHSVTTDNKVKTLDLIGDTVGYIDALYPKLSKAVRCFRCSFCFHLILNAQNGSISSDSRTKIIKILKQDRPVVIRDPKARKKTRFASLLSYCGFGFVKSIFSLARRR